MLRMWPPFYSAPGRWSPTLLFWLVAAAACMLTAAPLFVETNYFRVADAMASAPDAPLGAMPSQYDALAQIQVAEDIRHAAAVAWVGVGVLVGLTIAAYVNHAAWRVREVQGAIADAASTVISVRPVKA